MSRPGGTRDRMLASTVTLLRERGGGRTTVDAVLAHSGAPRGSVYHHFPGGRAEMIDSGVQLAGDYIATLLEDVADAGNPAAGLERFAEFWRRALRNSDFRAGCPVVGVALDHEATPSSAQIVAQIFHRWHGACVRLLEDAGHEPERAHRLATMTVSAVEGAVILCRVQHSTEPLDVVIAELAALARPPAGDGCGESQP